MIDPDEFLELLEGPRGPEIASKVIYTWLNRAPEGVPQDEIKAIVDRWPYRVQIMAVLEQVERLTVLEHQRQRVRGLNPVEHAHALAKLHASEFQLLTGIRQWLRNQIKDPNARKALGLD
jgi:hypothetical protein